MLDGPINGEAFRTYVERVLIPTLRPGDVVAAIGDGTVVLWSGVAVADFPKLSVVRHAAGPGAGGEVVMTGTFAPDT